MTFAQKLQYLAFLPTEDGAIAFSCREDKLEAARLQLWLLGRSRERPLDFVCFLHAKALQTTAANGPATGLV